MTQKRKCDCVVAGRVKGHCVMICAQALPMYISYPYWIGVGQKAPMKAKLNTLKCFYPYCPKCGAKIDFEKIKKEL